MAQDFMEVDVDPHLKKNAGKKVFLRAFSMGTMIVPTPGKVLCRYCNSRWSNIPNTA